MARATIAPALMRELRTSWAAVVPAGVDVQLGPDVSGNPTDYVIVGRDDPFEDRILPMVDAQQEFLYTGAVNRTETGSVSCVAFASVGDDDVDLALTRLEAILDPIATALRNNPSVFASVPELQWCHLTVTRLDAQVDQHGACAVAVFQIPFHAQL